MNDPISTVTYYTIWAGAGWGVISVLRIVFLTIFRLRGRRQLI